MILFMAVATSLAWKTKHCWAIYAVSAVHQVSNLLKNAISAYYKGKPINGTEWLIYFALLFLFWFAVATVRELSKRKKQKLSRKAVRTKR